MRVGKGSMGSDFDNLKYFINFADQAGKKINNIY